MVSQISDLYRVALDWYIPNSELETLPRGRDGRMPTPAPPRPQLGGRTAGLRKGVGFWMS